MAIAAKPGSPRWATAYPQGAAAAVVVIVTFGMIIAILLFMGSTYWVAVQALGWSTTVSWVFAFLWRETILKLPGTRNFASSKHRFYAQFACRSLIGAGMEFLVIETWDNLSRTSLAGHNEEFDAILHSVAKLVAGAKYRDPVREDARTFAQHVSALDQKLRDGGPK